MILELARVLKLLELYTVGVRVRRRGRTFCLEAPLLKKTLFIQEKRIKTTFDNGSLGSRIDEERSKMRYVM